VLEHTASARAEERDAAGLRQRAPRLGDQRVGRDPGARAAAADARAAIADYLGALERGGQVRDEDVEG
jgi:hypothetical protein